MIRRTATLAFVAALIGLGGCGGGHHQATKPTLVQTITSSSGQRAYKVKLPSGKVVTQAHSPTLAEPPKGLLKSTPTQSLTGTAEQYDSVTTSTIPASAHYVAGYVDGLYRTYAALRGRFPVVVGISVRSQDGADCFDMEPGNPGPQYAGPWAKSQFTAGNTRPCEYSMISWMPSIRANLARYGIPVCASASMTRCVRLWDANWTYRQHLDAGYACTQWTDHAFGRNLDASTCTSWFWRATPPPPPRPPQVQVPKYLVAQVFRFGSERASETNTARAWLAAKCHAGDRRKVCSSSSYHLRLLAGRDYFVAHHRLTAHGWVTLKQARWGYPSARQPLGSRFAYTTHLYQH